MQIVDIKNPTSKSRHKCELCGGIIDKGIKYSYVKHRTPKRLKAMKCCTNCFVVASDLGVIERDNISSYSFIRKVKDYIYDLHIRGGKPTTKSKIDKMPIKHLIDMVHEYYHDLEIEQAKAAEKSSARSFDSMRIEIALLTQALMMPTVFDNLIDSYSAANMFKFSLKSTLLQCLKEFEGMSKRLWNNFKGTDEIIKMSDGSLNVLDEIESKLHIDGIDKWANILMYCIEDMLSKYVVISKEKDVSQQILEMSAIDKKLKSHLQYNNYDFVKMVVSKECSGDNIRFIEENN